ncbi:annexin A1-like [Asparagus officinalis]|nr:annexin A1-like [Asparagus officinalis]
MIQNYKDLADDACLLETVQCLNSPPTYFCKIINQAFKEGAHKIEKEALNRVLVSRSETDMTEIKEVHHQLYGAKLEDVVATNTHGNYRDALLSLINGKE